MSGASQTTTGDIFFSVIIPVRNKVKYFRQALVSVLDQEFSEKEVIVINDGASESDLEEYRQIESEYPQARFVYLVHRLRGHGPSYSRNYGVELAKGRYIAFLDEDDYWTDSQHLFRVHKTISAAKEEKGIEIEAFYSNQDAYRDDGALIEPNPWIADLQDYLGSEQSDAQGTYFLNLNTFLKSNSFAHMNCSIYQKDFFLGLGGMDENQRYESDRALYLCALDNANHICFNPGSVSYHRVPDKTAKNNVSTAMSPLEKHLFQLVMYERRLLGAKTEEVRNHCLKHKGYQLMHIAEVLNSTRQYRLAYHHAIEALSISLSAKWSLRTLGIAFSALMKRE